MKRLAPVFALLAGSTCCIAQVPNTLNYQGYLEDLSGKPATGTVNVSISLYTNAASGAAVYAENVGVVALSKGVYSFRYGSANADWTNALRNADVWVELTLNGAALTPRQSLVAVPYALFAQTAVDAQRLGGHSPDDFALAAGKSFKWVVVSNATQQAESNTGYLINCPDQVTVSLPVAPGLGDIVRVTGAGGGGWKVAKGDASILASRELIGSWTARENIRKWTGVACSSDGTKLVATVENGRIYVSPDSGETWTPRETNRNWRAVASSANGAKLVAVVGGGQIYTSVDSGASWTPRETNRNWRAVASSADGVKLVAAATGDYIYVSSDSGVNWTRLNSFGYWNALACTADGSKLIVIASDGYIFFSPDTGANWTAWESKSWQAACCTADGARLFATASDGTVYTSTDWGLTRSEMGYSATCYSLACSNDGRVLLRGLSAGLMISTDGGGTWTQYDRSPGEAMVKTASSADGTVLVGVGSRGSYIYTSTAVVRHGLTGPMGSCLELQYIGNGAYMTLSSQGNVVAY